MSLSGLQGRLTAAFFGAGFLATAAQVFLLREHLVNAAGDEASLGAGLAAWLSGIALGAKGPRFMPETRASTASAPLFALLATGAPCAIFFGRVARYSLSPPAGELPGLGAALLLATLTLFPAGAFVGALFTSLATASARLWPAGDGITRLYVAESMGSLAGGFLTSLALVSGLPPFRAALLAGLLATLMATPATLSGLLGSRALAAATATGLAGLLAFGGSLDKFSERLRFQGLVPDLPFGESLDTPYQHLAVTDSSPVSLYAGGKFAQSFPDPWSAETLAHEAACLTEHPARVFALSSAALGPLRFLLRHPVTHLDIPEPDTAALAFLRARLPKEDRAALDDLRVSLVAEDPRRFLQRGRKIYDLMLLAGPEPVTLLGTRLSSAEFFRECSAHLSPRGVLVLPVRTAPAALAGETEFLAGSLFGALAAAFPVVRATPGPESLFVAGHDPAAVTLDADVLAERFRDRGIDSDVFSGELFRVNFLADRVQEMESSLRTAAKHVPKSSDDRPVSFLHALARRQRETGSWAGKVVLSLGHVPPAGLMGLALVPSVLVLVWRKRCTSSATHAVAAAGASGMVLSLLLLFSFQIQEGALYGELGFLTALFMFGLAGGALFSQRWLSLPASVGLALAVAAAIALLLPQLRSFSMAGPVAALAAHGGLLLLAGVATGGVFPAASAVLVSSGTGVQETAGRLETADHAGAAVAAFVGTVIYIPALGMRLVAWLAVVLLALAFLDSGTTSRKVRERTS